MLVVLLVWSCAVFSAQATTFSQEIKPLHLHAKFGGGLPEIISEENPLEVVDKYVTSVAKNILTSIRRPFTFVKPIYGPIENVIIPGANILFPVNLTDIKIMGLKKFKLKDLQWRMATNRVDFRFSLPYLFVDVTFKKLMLLNTAAGSVKNAPFYSNVRLSIRLLDVNFTAAIRYNTRVTPTEPAIFIDKAEVELNSTNISIDIKVDYGVEEIRYSLAEILNHPLEDIMDAVLKIVVQELNQETLAKVSPREVISYLISKIPPEINLPTNSLTINHV